MREAYIYDALRTPRGRGKITGSLYEVRPIQLMASVLNALIAKHPLETKQVDDAIIGCATPIDDQGYNIAKASLLYAGWDDSVGGVQINRFCTSGLDAVNLAASKIKSGWEDLIVAGGVESMSRVPIGSDAGPLQFDPDVINRIGYLPQGIAADLIATKEGYTRNALDEYALMSQQRAFLAQQNGYLKKSIVPIYDDNTLLILDKDEHLRPDSTIESLASLPPSFEQIGINGFDALATKKYPHIERIQHLHTAGNSSGIADGAALVLVGSREKGKALGLTPRAKIISLGTVSSEPTLMLGGANPAIEKALQRAKMTIKDIDLWEVNEAFASVALKTLHYFNIDIDKYNVNGGAIAFGHPLGATGAMLLGTVLDELERRNLQTAVVSMAAGGGLGVATIIERV